MADTTCATLYGTVNKFKNGNNVNDRLRKLPESVLGHILSLLPTKYAVRTSVLSTEWKYMWTLATNLHFVDCDLFDPRRRESRKAMFSNFVERVLLLNGNSSIESFYLSCASQYDEPRVDSWISTAIRRNAKRICIHNYRGMPDFVFPRCIHESKSLTELELFMPCVLKVPSSTCFASLKILSLRAVLFQNESFSLSNKLHLNFPVLEEFNLQFCKWLNVEFVNIYVPALEVFTVSCDMWTPAGMLDCVVNIKGSSITKFMFHSTSFTSQYNLISLSSVVDASIEVSKLESNWGQMYDFGSWTFSLLKQFSNVKNLILSSGTVAALACLEDLQVRLPTFDNLVNLTFSRVGHVIDMTLITLLRSSPALESLILEDISGFNEEEVVRETVPHCLTSKLKVVKIKNFYGCEAEFETAKFLLKNAKVLVKMTIITSSWKRPQYEENKNELLTFPKCSSCATLLFS